MVLFAGGLSAGLVLQDSVCSQVHLHRPAAAGLEGEAVLRLVTQSVASHNDPFSLDQPETAAALVKQAENAALCLRIARDLEAIEAANS